MDQSLMLRIPQLEVKQLKLFTEEFLSRTIKTVHVEGVHIK